MPQWTVVLLFLAELVLKLSFAGFILLRGKREPPSTLAWILVVLAIPFAGVIAYLLVGEVRFGAPRRRRHRDIVRRMRVLASQREGPRAPYPQIDERWRPIARLAEMGSGNRARSGNGVELIHETDDAIERLVADLDAARRHCHLLFYIYLADGAGRRVAAALARTAARGVACRLLVDAVGSRDFLRSGLCGELRAAGVRVVAALPASLPRVAVSRLDLRNHRKIAVIDGLVAYTGSQNIADASFAPKPRAAPWVDATLRITGPAVRDLQEIFVGDWYLDSGEALDELIAIEPPPEKHGRPVQVLASGPGSDNVTLQHLNEAAFHLAREELILTTPYFVPAEAAVSALCTAARRGVQTRVVVPRRNDSRLVAMASRSFYPRMLDAGVEIFEYDRGLLHAKTLSVDSELALVSTANFDRRSFELNFEVSVLVYDGEFASRLRWLQRDYMESSLRVDATLWHERSWMRALAENTAGMLGPLL